VGQRGQEPDPVDPSANRQGTGPGGAADRTRGHEPADVDDDVVIEVERPVEALAPMRRPLLLVGTAVAGYAMGVAEVVPGFSGGTVALVAGIYERLIANIRQGAHALALLLRGRPPAALRAVAAMEWLFIGFLLTGMVVALVTVASGLRALIDERPVETSAVFLGLVLGASVLAARRLREPTALHVLLGVVSAAGFFVLLGLSTGAIAEPALVLVFAGGAVAICAWILPGVSGSFLLLVIGLYAAVLDALADLDLLVLGVFALGCVAGLAAFSTLLNWALARFHDVVMAILIGLMVGSARVLWPWPADQGIGNPELGAPEGDAVFLAIALGLAAFALVWMFGLVTSGLERRRDRRSVADPGGTEA
jgi:putative membrane protein